MKHPWFLSPHCLGLLASLFAVSAAAAEAPVEVAAEGVESSRFVSPEDGWLDISGFIDQAYGFVPMVVPITEPAVGYGAVGALVFIDKQQGDERAGFGRPNIFVAGALRTDNETKGVFAADVRHWLDDRVKTIAAIVHASVNLEFSGIGRDPLLRENPRSYNMDTMAGVFQARFRLGDSQTWLGLGYVLASTTIEFDILPALESLPEFSRKSRVGGLLPTVNFDSRNNVFTPTEGTYLEMSAGLFSKDLGSDTNFERVSLTGIHYLPLARSMTLGILANSVMSFGEVPFYLRPFITLRGTPAMRYQGDHIAQLEGELRWQLWERFSVVAFGGVGTTRNEDNDRSQDVNTKGVGFRYEIARKYGLHMGVDVAYDNDGPVYYVQFGNAWMRP